ncbi:hypothetical protein J6590_095794 [Homalodisca vitripennis]|nr:hypothetical protein J6590_067352 [Homalodisca vitripennis]KAG8255310.1 hypothetical protein J6590_095794 [Homalodisca vitripennis]
MAANNDILKLNNFHSGSTAVCIRPARFRGRAARLKCQSTRFALKWQSAVELCYDSGCACADCRCGRHVDWPACHQSTAIDSRESRRLDTFGCCSRIRSRPFGLVFAALVSLS